MKAQFINLGRNNINKTIVVKSQKELRKEIQANLLSKGWDLEETEEPNTYEVTAGFRTVGIIKILEP